MGRKLEAGEDTGRGSLPRITLTQLRAFATVARLRSFARACEHLDVSQPTLSEEITRAERAVGHRLLRRRRGARHVEITDAGEILLAAYEDVAARLEHAWFDLGTLGAGQKGTVRFGAEPVFGGYMMPGIMGAARGAYPAIDIVAQVDLSRRLVARVHDRRLDLAVVVGGTDVGDAVCVPIGAYDAVCIARIDQVESLASLSFRELAIRPWILPKRGFVLRDKVERIAAEHGVRPRAAMELDSNEAKIKAVLDGIGMAVVAAPAAAALIAAGQVGIVPVPGFPIAVQWLLVRAPHVDSPATAAFAEFVAAHVRRQLPETPGALRRR